MLDELERVRAYRADVPDPDAATTLAARAELMDAIGREPRTARPFYADLVRNSGVDPQRSRRQRRRRLVLASGLAAAGVAVAGVLGFRGAGNPPSALAAEMNQLAQVAANQDWTGIPGPGQYLYTESEGTTGSDEYANGHSCIVQLVQHREIWIATDGSGALNETDSQGRFTSAGDQEQCAAMHITDPASEDASGGNRFPAGGLSFPTNDWRSLSTDPATLLAQVHQRDGGPDTPAEKFVNVADFMRESDVPPAIRAALYQALPLIPGVKLLGPQTDPTGRTGLAVAFYADGEPTHELIFDQQTGRLLAERYYDKTGKVSDWTAYVAQKIVDSVPNYPMQQSTPPPGQATTPSPTSSSTP